MMYLMSMIEMYFYRTVNSPMNNPALCEEGGPVVTTGSWGDGNRQLGRRSQTAEATSDPLGCSWSSYGDDLCGLR